MENRYCNICVLLSVYISGGLYIMKIKKVCFCKKCGALDYADEECPKCGSPEIDEASMDFLLFGNVMSEVSKYNSSAQNFAFTAKSVI